MFTVASKVHVRTIARLQISMNGTFRCIMVQIMKTFTMCSKEACAYMPDECDIKLLAAHLVQSPLPTSGLVQDQLGFFVEIQTVNHSLHILHD